MSAKIIAMTKFNDEELNLEEMVAYVARVSNPANQANHRTSKRLVKYLIRNKHWSPLQLVNVVVEVTCSRAIARQILRHRSFTFQEFSYRYATSEQLPAMNLTEARMQDTTNRQSSLFCDDDDELKERWFNAQEHVVDLTTKIYQWGLEMGLAKEVCRAVLPEGITTSRMYINGSLRSWVHYLQVRLDKSTQLEHRELAEEILEALLPHFPLLKDIVK